MIMEPDSNSTALRQSLQQLDRLLLQQQWLWGPQPFKQRAPSWCERLPQLCEKLLALGDQQLEELAADSGTLIALLQEYIPQLSDIESLVRLPACKTVALDDLGPHFNSGIPGRKWQQIERFAGALGPVNSPLIEWCGGKGHLGRLLSAQWQVPVTTLEHDDELCRAGEHHAKRSGVEQRFYRIDALSEEAGNTVNGHHAVALHACGELHRSLLRAALQSGITAFDIAPCCYYLGAGETYQSFNPSLQLKLKRDDLRLAVTETVTAKGREVAKRDQEMAWKLGYLLLCQEQCGADAYHSIKPIPKGWLTLDFAGFCQQLAEREGRALPAAIDWDEYEKRGWRRQYEVMRFNLVRAAFRRALEMWLVLDMAVYIADQGYAVELATFCDRELTPRNILISARRA